MPVSRESVLYYEPENSGQASTLKAVLVRMGVRIKNVPPERTGQAVGVLLGRKGFIEDENAQAPALAEPLLVMDGFSDKRLDILLREMRQAGVLIPYKAVVTQDNLHWPLCRLYEELCAEHEALSR